jgi:hypothetical protein
MASTRLLILSAPLSLGYVCSLDIDTASCAQLTCVFQVTYLNSVVMPDPLNADAGEDSESD